MHLHQTQFTCKTHPSQNRRRFVVLVASLMVCAPAMRVRAQADGNTARDEVVALTPFTVVSDRDTGYAAENTLAGSRLNTSLKDTAASISVFTADFLQDIGAESLEEAMAYATNLQVDYEDTASNMTGNLIAENFTNYRVRGMKASQARNFFAWGLPVEVYNVERIEDSRGPNSILFGIGSAGGIINASTKRANLRSRRESISFSASSFDSYRAAIDVNEALVRDVLGVRLNAVWSDKNTQRLYSGSEEKRFHLAATYRPTQSTSVRIEFERGRIYDQVVKPWTMFDKLSIWDNAGAVLFATPTTTGATVAANGVARLAAGAQRLTYVENSGQLFNFRGMLATDVPGSNVDTVFPFDVMDESVNPEGPGAHRETRLSNHSIAIEQRLGPKTFAELAYNHQKYTFDGFDAAENLAHSLVADPNTYLPNGLTTVPTYGPAGGVNPYAGWSYVETNWFRRNRAEEWNTVRLTLSHELDLGKWGNYRAAGMAEFQRHHYERRESWEAWDVGSGLIPAGQYAENVNNKVWRRYYIDDYRNQGLSRDWTNYRVPTADTLISSYVDPSNGRVLNSTWVQRNGNLDDDYTDLTTFLFGLQARYFNNRLIGVFGYRRDNAEVTDRVASAATAGAAGVAAHDPVTKEIIIDQEFSYDEAATTRTLGAVFHVTRDLSLYYNTSDNVALPNGAHRVLPDSGRADLGEGHGQDISAGLELLDGKIVLRATYFESEGLKETDFRSVVTHVTQRNNRVLDTLLANGLITSADAEARRVNVNAGYSDRSSEGYEFSLTANPAKSWRIRANYSITDAIEDNIIPEVVAWAGDAIAYWETFDPNLITTGTTTLQKEVTDLRDYLDDQTYVEGRAARGNRKHKMTVFTHYEFQQGVLKGLSLGGGFRYQGERLAGRNQATGELFWGDPTTRWDASASYGFSLFRNRVRGSLQLNVFNVTDDRDPLASRYDATGRLTRYEIPAPRTWRLSSTFRF